MSRLFIVSVAGGYGGAERSVEIIARHLPPHLQTHIYAAHPEHLERLRDAARSRTNLQIGRLSAASGANARRLQALRLAVDYLRLAPEVIVANTHASALLCAMAARFAPTLAEKTSLYVHDFMWEDLDYIFARLGHRNVLVPDAVVLRRLGYLTPFFRKPDLTDATVVPNMIERSDRVVTYDGPLLHLATVNRMKGHTHLLVAVQRLKMAGRAVHITSVGHAPDRELLSHLEQLRKRLDIEAQFQFGGPISDPGELLSRCRAVVVSTVPHWGGPETFGRTIIEAWAHAKPVVAYATGAPANLITHDVDGLLVPPEDTDALASALYRLWSDPDLCRRLGEAGRRNVEQRFATDVVMPRLLVALGLGVST